MSAFKRVRSISRERSRSRDTSCIAHGLSARSDSLPRLRQRARHVQPAPLYAYRLSDMPREMQSLSDRLHGVEVENKFLRRRMDDLQHRLLVQELRMNALRQRLDGDVGVPEPARAVRRSM